MFKLKNISIILAVTAAISFVAPKYCYANKKLTKDISNSSSKIYKEKSNYDSDEYIFNDFNSLNPNSKFNYYYFKLKRSEKELTFTEINGEYDFEIPVSFKGWHSVYMGLIGDSDDFDVKFGDEVIGTDLKNKEFNNSLSKNIFKEVFLTNKNFNNEKISIHIPERSKVKIAYIKFEKMDHKQIELWEKDNSTKFTVIYDNDGFSDFFEGENGSLDEFKENTIYQYDRLNASKINYCIGTTGLVFYDSKYAGKPFNNFQQYEDKVREGDVTAKTDILNLIDNENAPIGIISEEKNNMGVFASIRINSFFPNDYRNFLNGNIYDKLKPFTQKNNFRMSFYYNIYRQYLLNIISEVGDNFDVEGITLDFTRAPNLFGDELLDQNTRKDIITKFIKNVRAEVPKHMKINIRCPYNYYDYNFDLKTWIENGYIDAVSPSVLSKEDFFDILPFVIMTKNTDVKLYIGITANCHGEDLNVDTEKIYKESGNKKLKNRYLSVEQYIIRTYVSYLLGADGVFLFNVNCQIGEDSKLPDKLSTLSSVEALKKWYTFQYSSFKKTEPIRLLYMKNERGEVVKGELELNKE